LESWRALIRELHLFLLSKKEQAKLLQSILQQEAQRRKISTHKKFMLEGILKCPHKSNPLVIA